jgi:hypothetical protein
MNCWQRAQLDVGTEQQARMFAVAQHEHGSVGEDGDDRGDEGDMHDVEEDMSEGEEDDDEDDVIDDEILDGGGRGEDDGGDVSLGVRRLQVSNIYRPVMQTKLGQHA